MTLVEVHGRLATTAMLFIIIMMLWGLWRFIRRQGVDGNFRGALAVAEILLLVQGALGSFLYISGTGALERGYVHILYGVVGALAIPAIFLYTREDENRLSVLVYVAVLLFLVGVLFRSMATSG
ncbi:hypothetical protein ACFLZW_02920 [Chloroflexota bacterium]